MKRKEPRSHQQEGIFTAISIGFFFLLVGTIFIINDNLLGSILDFFGDFTLVTVPNTSMMLPAPEHLRLHLTIYEASRQVSIALAIFQVVMLALRFVLPSSWNKRSEAVGDFVYWLGASFLIQSFLIESTQWFVFWSTILILLGVTIIVKGAVKAVSRI